MTELTPANENPWYILATICGEFERHVPNSELLAQNRRMWNGWACSGMSDEHRKSIANKIGLPIEELAELEIEERMQLEAAFRDRVPEGIAIPLPKDQVALSKTLFSNTVIFNKYVFAGSASIADCIFEGGADFSSCYFCEFCNLGGTEFKSNAWFEAATFCGPPSFNSAIFLGANFTSAEFGKMTDFGKAIFSHGADFSNSVFKKTARFNRTKFAGAAPKFFETVLHQDTRLSTETEYWPPVSEGDPQDSIEAYTRLRQVMNELQKPEEEHFFYRQEMRWRVKGASGWKWLLLVLFQELSEFGYSIARPIYCLTTLLIVPFLIYLVKFNWDEIVYETYHTKFESIALSFASIFKIFGFQGLYFDSKYMNGLHPALQFLSGIQTILGFVFLFFLALGLRNRFRLR
ncbi:pentapeptide repeat-containing protein [Pseudohalocynthiibacter aestuariivivens]|uniref:Pentapeptide repeat-containing protein n=1 Tax=Pseudohalocynthiibacter aestuariivivens TaxID=1591409 RepID=A0ABV5JCC8_9RHOB|nr:pentapeptide repeat-containing protein [Pseudohalocynthiibacter aestuariivivens]MBS9718545.1 pentapeptide repeat-containing protein [Pseudohalocynthiibacter aestuariivivens]